MASSSPPVTESAQSRRNAHVVKGKALNCLPCRQHKLRCDRHVPCSNCRKSKRDDLCRRHPAPAPGRFTKTRDVQTHAQVVNPRGELSSHRHHTLPCSTLSHQVYQSESAVEASAISGESGESQYMSNNSSIQPSSASIDQATSFLHKAARRVSNLHMLGIYDELEVQRTQLGPGAVEESLTDVGPTLFPLNAMQTQIASTVGVLTAPWNLSSNERELFWKRHLTKALPTQNQCDVLISYYIENINWIFQSIHVPSFRKEYALFWSTNVDDIDLIWLSLLYTIISISGLYIPAEAIRITGILSSNIRSLAHTWHSASRQALHAGDFEAQPRLTQLQTFSITQLYWYATNKVETLNSALAQAVRNAQAIGLDKDTDVATSLEKEMRHRAWWDLCDSDTFQSICLSRPPLIQARLSKVPFPLNCNDIDITETTIHPRPIDHPTEMSQNVFRARVFKIFNKLYVDDGAHVLSYDFVESIDAEISTVVQDFPWYFRIQNNVSNSVKLPPALDFISWQFHILHSCICTQRMRMYRAFLHPQVGDSWMKCVSAAEDSFTVYRNIRDKEGDRFVESQKFLGQAYQIFSVAVAVAALLIVEGSVLSPNLRGDLEMAILDLKSLDTQETTVSLAAEGRKVLARMLQIHDLRGASSPEESEALVSGISSVFGGEQSARTYLKRCNVRQLLTPGLNARDNSTHKAHGTLPTELPPPNAAASTGQSQEALMGGSVSTQVQDGWYDFQPMDVEFPSDIFNWWPAELPQVDSTV